MGSVALARLCGRVSLLDAVIARASRVDWAPGALPVPNETPVRQVPGQPAPAGTADGDPLPAPVDHRIRRFAAVAAEPLGHPPLPSDCSARRRSSRGVVISRLTRFQGQLRLEKLYAKLLGPRFDEMVEPGGDARRPQRFRQRSSPNPGLVRVSPATGPSSARGVRVLDGFAKRMPLAPRFSARDAPALGWLRLVGLLKKLA